MVDSGFPATTPYEHRQGADAIWIVVTEWVSIAACAICARTQFMVPAAQVRCRERCMKEFRLAGRSLVRCGRAPPAASGKNGNIYARPADPDRVSGSIPSRFSAAVHLPLSWAENTRSGGASAVSQLFWPISASSWPGPQPD